MKKVMRLWDIVFMNVAVIIGIRWLPIAAGYGAGAIILWVLAALLFFVPLSLVATELATTWPDEGGLYVWVREAFGDKSAFLISWFYWIDNFFFYPSLIAFAAITAAFLIEPNLAQSKFFISATIIGCLWAVTLLNFRSMRIVKWVANIAGIFGVILPGLIIVALAIAAVFIWKHPIPTDYSWSQWWPNLGSGSNIAFLSTLMFAMAGMEITPILAGEVKNPQKTFPRALFISALFIIILYIIGTVAITFLIAPDKIGSASGIMDALALITGQLHLPFVLTIVALMILLGTFGGVSVWIVAPIKMLLESTKQGVLPNYLTKLNKHDMPSNAMLIQAVVITFIILGTSFLPSVNAFYETLILMATVTYFIPYLFMFITFLQLRKSQPNKFRPYRVPGGKFIALVIAIFGFFSVLLAIILPFVAPPQDLTTTRDIVIYELELASGPLVFFIVGYLLYALYERRLAKNL
jgi:amino acid transporter